MPRTVSGLTDLVLRPITKYNVNRVLLHQPGTIETIRNYGYPASERGKTIGYLRKNPEAKNQVMVYMKENPDAKGKLMVFVFNNPEQQKLALNFIRNNPKILQQALALIGM